MLFAPFRRGPLIRKVGVGLNPTIGGATAPTQIQYGSISINDGSATGTATITSVVLARSYVVSLGQGRNANGTAITSATLATRVSLTNATTVTATRTTGTNYVLIRFMVVEWPAGTLLSVQENTATIANDTTSQTFTLTSVVVAKTTAYYLGCTTNDTTDSSARAHGATTLTNATTVTVDRPVSATFATVVGFSVPEFA